MNSFEKFLVEFLIEARSGEKLGAWNSPHFKSSHKSGERGKRASGYAETERPGEERIAAQQDRVTKRYQEIADDPDASEDDKRDAEQYSERGPGWKSTSDRKNYGRGNKK